MQDPTTALTTALVSSAPKIIKI